MKKSEIKVGGHYLAKVGGRVVTVRVDVIRAALSRLSGAGKEGTFYDVTNLTTGRKTTFRSAARFRSAVWYPTDKPPLESFEINILPAMDSEGVASASSICPRCGQTITITDGCYDYHRKPNGITCGMSGEKVTVVGRNSCGTIVVGKPEEVLPLKSMNAVGIKCPDCGTDLWIDSESEEAGGAPFYCSGCCKQISEWRVGQSTDPTDAAVNAADRSTSSEGALSTYASVDSPSMMSAPTTTESSAPSVLPGSSQPATPTSSGRSAGDEGCASTDQKMEGEKGSDPISENSGTASTDSLSPLATLLRKSVEWQQQSSDGKVAGYTPTEEQAAILKLVQQVYRQDGVRVIVVGAGAGTGKTSQLKMIEAVLPGRGQYTAFNAPLVAESKPKFIKAKCNTTHSLAFGAVGKKFQHRLGGNRVRSSEIAAILGIESMKIAVPDSNSDTGETKEKTLQAGHLASKVMAAIRKFCQSADEEITTAHFEKMTGVDVPGQYTNQDAVVQSLVVFAHKAWEDLSNPDGKLPFAHDCYVKQWQLGRGQDTPVIPADYILLDEAQDTAPVFLDVLRRQSALIILVGDDCQQIYEWRGACNAMKAFPGAPRRLLSQSFRFGQTIADVANSILATLDEPTDLVMSGLESIPSRVVMPGSWEDSGSAARSVVCRAVLCRTNACAVGTVLQSKREGKRPHLIGGGADVVAFVKAARDLQSSRGTSHPELCLFSNWREVQAYVKEDEGSDLKLMVKLIDEFRCQPILDALENMPREEDADLVVSTAHKSKGREWSSVRLASDFPPANKMGDADRRLLYVAATRAQHVLDISQCPPFIPSRDRESGEEIVPIRVRFTVPMPTAEQLAEWMTASGKSETAKSSTQENSGNGGSNGTAPKDGFTWARYGDKWCLRGPAGTSPGTVVTVAKKSGQTSRETVGAVLREDPGVPSVLYAVK